MNALFQEYRSDIRRLQWPAPQQYGPWLGAIMANQGVGYDEVELHHHSCMWSRLELGCPGVSVLVLSARVHPDDWPYDLFAVVPETGCVFRRKGIAVALGEHLLETCEGSLLVTLSPVGWLHSGGSGVCPVDIPAFADWVLRHPEISLTVPSVSERNRLLSALDTARGRLPAISIVKPDTRRSS